MSCFGAAQEGLILVGKAQRKKIKLGSSGGGNSSMFDVEMPGMEVNLVMSGDE